MPLLTNNTNFDMKFTASTLLLAVSFAAECPYGGSSAGRSLAKRETNDRIGLGVTELASTWQNIIATSDSAKWGNPLATFAGLLFESMVPTVDHASDVMPKGRKKLIHSVGVVAQAKYVPVKNSANYTGIFAEGADNALVRLSLAQEPAKGKNDIVPGAAIKFYRDGLPSANFPFMHALASQESYNFFANDFSNHVITKDQPAPLPIIAKKFGTVSKWPGFVGLSDVATYNQQGVRVKSPSFPFQIITRPVKGVSTIAENTNGDDILQQIIANVPAGTDVWDVYASPSPNSPFEKIGKITTTSDMVTSSYSDEQLFFRHQRFEEDLEVHPEWLEEGCPSMEECPSCHILKTCRFI